VSETFTVSPIGLNEQMVVEVEPLCQCPCSGDEQIDDDLRCQVSPTLIQDPASVFVINIWIKIELNMNIYCKNESI
jgi:hypothetical protein